jgi:predicted Fe-Mo cluster-binding NifX family protein
MTIAITATGNTLNSMVDPRFGRAAWFLIIDPDTKQLIEAIDNTAGKEAAQGAGIAAAAQVADKGVEALLTGRVGPKAMPVLEKAGVLAVNDVSGTILEAIDSYVSKDKTDQAKTDPVPPQNNVQNPGQGQGQGCGCGKGRGQGKGMGQGKGQGRGQCRK